MKTTKDHVFEYVQKEIFSNADHKEGVPTTAVAAALQLQRSNASTLLNELVKEGKLEKRNGRPVLYYLPIQPANDYSYADKKFIGIQGSLAKAMQIAKAAILYPKNSLNMLISAKPGCGTTHFVYTMFWYAKETGVLQEDAPFLKVNCRHYQKNITDLDDVLFGTRGGGMKIWKKAALPKRAKACCFWITPNC